jgi:hypothetical protein
VERQAPPAVGRDATVLQFPTALVNGAGTDDVGIDQVGIDQVGIDVVGTAEVGAAAETVVAGDEIDDDEVTASDVDDLFARLRAQRTDATADAGVDEGTAGDVVVSPFARRDEVLTPLIVAAARKLKRVLADEQNSALEVLRRKEAVRAIDQLAGDSAAHVARYADAVVNDLLAAAQAGADSVSHGTGESADAAVGRADAAVGRADPSDGHVVVTSDVDPVRAAVAANLIIPLRDRLAERIAAGDGDNDDIARSARAVYREWKTKHIDDELDDLLRMAHGCGVVAALADDATCRWVADPAVGACSDCEDNTLQGEVKAGAPYPTGHVVPPAHAGCRCLILPARK